MAKKVAAKPAAQVRRTQLPGCCGVQVLHEAQYGPGVARTEENFRAGVKAKLAKGLGLCIYTLNDAQKMEAAALRKMGFEACWGFKNPSSGRQVTVYAKES